MVLFVVTAIFFTNNIRQLHIHPSIDEEVKKNEDKDVDFFTEHDNFAVLEESQQHQLNQVGALFSLFCLYF